MCSLRQSIQLRARSRVSRPTGNSHWKYELRVGAGVKGLNEMTIGRTEDQRTRLVQRLAKLHPCLSLDRGPIWATDHGAASTRSHSVLLSTT